MRSNDLPSQSSYLNSGVTLKVEGEVEIIPEKQNDLEAGIVSAIRNYYKANDKLKLFWEEREYDISNSFINLVIIEQEEAKDKEKELRGKEEERGNKDDSQEYREQRISSYEEIHRAKKPIEIKQLFKEAKSKKLVIYGRAGIGKTTLCQYLTVAWQKEEIWQNKFKAVIKLPLRELANYIETENSATLEGFIKQTYLPGVRGIRESEIAQFLGNKVSNILYLLDGYDEIVPLLRKPGVGAKLGSIVRGIIEDGMAYTIVTSRPARIEHKFDQEYENVGFIDQDIERYVSTFKSERAKEILDFLKNNKSLWGIAHIPINLELICSAWGISGGIDKVSTMSQLYGAITDRLMERYVVKNHAIELDDLTRRKFNKKTQPIVRCLERIAFRGMENNQIIIPIKEIRGIIREEEKRSGVGNLLREVLKSGMVKVIGENHDENREIYFLHLSFQEYYAAKYIARAINNVGTEEYKQVYAFISENKYIPYYEVMMWFSAGILYQAGRARGNYEGLNEFWRIVDEESLDLIGIRHVTLVIRCLEECEANEKIEKHKEIIKYIKQWIRALVNISDSTLMAEILKTTPHISRATAEVFIELMKDEDRWVRVAAAKSLSKIRQGSEKVIGELIIALKNKDKNEYVSAEAARSLGKVGQGSEKAINSLIIALNYGHKDVMRRAAESLGKLGQGSEKVIDALIIALNYRNYRHEDVRRAAAKSLGEIGQGSEEVIKALITALKDEYENEYLRKAAAESLGRIGQGSEEVINTLLITLKDKNFLLSYAAAESLGRIGQGSEKVINALIIALNYEHQDVRYAAAGSLGRIGQGSEEIINSLIILLTDKHNWVKKAAVESLGRIGQGSEKVINSLIIALNYGHKDVRRAAALGLVSLFNNDRIVAKVIAKQAVDNDLIDEIIRNSDSFKLALFCFKYRPKEEWLSSILINMLEKNVGLILNKNGRLKLISGKDIEEIIINDQQTALLLSKLSEQRAEAGIPEIASEAIKQIVSINFEILPNKQEELFKAVLENNQSVLSSLISNDVDINIKNKQGDTALHYAIRIKSNIELIKILIRGGASLNAINGNSNIPFDLAAKLGRADIASYIENKIVLGRISKKGNFSKGIRKAIADGTYSLCQDKYNNCGESYRKAISLAVEEDNQIALCYVILKAGDYFLHPGNEDYRSASLCYSMARGIAERYFEVNEVLDMWFFDHKQEYLEAKYLRSIGYNIKPVIRSREYKQNLKEIRIDCKKSLEQNVDIKSILEKNTISMIKLTAKIIEDCIKLLGASPCEYSIIGLGSMSRGEMALYSDIEYAVIVEDKSYNEYFYQLARLFEIKIVSIGETSPNTEVGKVVGSEVLLDFMRNGYSIDAVNLSPNFGLNTREKASNLINTVEGLVSLQQDMDVILPNALRTVCLIYGSKKLLNSYEAAVRNFTLNKSFGKEQAIELLKGDLEQYAPKYNDSNLMDYFDAKNDFYRLPSNLARYLSLYYGLEGKNSWNSLENLLGEGYINEISYEEIKILLEYAALMRIKTHLYYEEEKEKIYHQGAGGDIEVRYKFSKEEKNELEEKYKILIEIREGIKEFIANSDKKTFRYKEGSRELILIKAKAAYASGKKEEAMKLFNQAIISDPNNLEVLKPLTRLMLENKQYEKAKSLAKNIEKIALKKYGSSHEDIKEAEYILAKIKIYELEHGQIKEREQLKSGNSLFSAIIRGVKGVTTSSGENKQRSRRLIADNKENEVGAQIIKGSMQYKKLPSQISSKEGEDSRVNISTELEGNVINKLFKAVKYNNISEVKELIGEGVDINYRENKCGRTALHLAVLNGNIEIIQLLTTYSAQVSLQDAKGRTPLHIAAKHNREEVIKLLLEKGIDKDIRDNRGKVAKDHVGSGSFQLKLLLESKGNDKRNYL